ncbi:MAG: tetratricopeptide repeat protein [Alphaproteobacteria bacterium]
MSTSLVSIIPPAPLSAALSEAGHGVAARHPLRRRYLLGAKRGWPLSMGVTYLALFGMLTLNSCVNQKNVAAEEAPLTEDAIVRLADKMRSQGDVTMAADFYQRALERDANNISAYLGLAALHEQMGQPEQAGRYYLEAIRRDGRNMNTRRAYARLLMTQEQYGAATEQYQAALSGDGEDPRSRNGIGVALDQQGQHVKAQDHYRQVLTRDPDNMTALNNLGLSLLATGDAKGAIAVLAPAADSLKMTPTLRQNLALAYVMDGQDAMALGLLRRDLGAAEAGRILAQLRKQQRAGVKPVSQTGGTAARPRGAAMAAGMDESADPAPPNAAPTTPVATMPELMADPAAPVAVRKPLNPVVAEIAANANMPAGIVLTGDDSGHSEAKPVAAEPDAAPRVQAVAIAKPEPMPKPAPAPPAAPVIAAMSGKDAPVKDSPVAQPAARPMAVVPSVRDDAPKSVVNQMPRVTPPVTPPVARKPSKAAPTLVFTPPVVPEAVATPGAAATKSSDPVVTGKREQPTATRPLLARAQGASVASVAAHQAYSATVGPFATGAMADVHSTAIRNKFSGYLPARPVMNVKTNLSASGTPQFVVQIHGFAATGDAQDFCDHVRRRDYSCAAR